MSGFQINEDMSMTVWTDRDYDPASMMPETPTEAMISMAWVEEQHCKAAIAATRAWAGNR